MLEVSLPDSNEDHSRAVRDERYRIPALKDFELNSRWNRVNCTLGHMPRGVLFLSRDKIFRR